MNIHKMCVLKKRKERNTFKFNFEFGCIEVNLSNVALLMFPELSQWVSSWNLRKYILGDQRRSSPPQEFPQAW